MIKRVCDNCGEEMKDKEVLRFKGSHGKIAIEIMYGTIDGGITTWNKGDICHICIIEAVNEIQKEKRAQTNGH